MQIPAVQTERNTTQSIPPSNKAEQQKSQFLHLLVAQMKGQNPLSPMDGAEFVAQLAQFSSLEELINIRTTLDNVQQILNQPQQTAGVDRTETQRTI